jgi:hypothetical protein
MAAAAKEEDFKKDRRDKEECIIDYLQASEQRQRKQPQPHIKK